MYKIKNKQTPWPESASEVYRPSNRRLSAKLMKTFADKECHVVDVHIKCASSADTRDLKPIDMEVCYWALLFMPLVILHHLLNVSVQLANKRGLKQKKQKIFEVIRYFRTGKGARYHKFWEPLPSQPILISKRSIYGLSTVMRSISGRS
jgi:hypothetical protein